MAFGPYSLRCIACEWKKRVRIDLSLASIEIPSTCFLFYSPHPLKPMDDPGTPARRAPDLTPGLEPESIPGAVGGVAPARRGRRGTVVAAAAASGGVRPSTSSPPSSSETVSSTASPSSSVSASKSAPRMSSPPLVNKTRQQAQVTAATAAAAAQRGARVPPCPILTASTSESGWESGAIGEAGMTAAASAAGASASFSAATAAAAAAGGVSLPAATPAASSGPQQQQPQQQQQRRRLEVGAAVTVVPSSPEGLPEGALMPEKFPRRLRTSEPSPWSPPPSLSSSKFVGSNNGKTLNGIGSGSGGERGEGSNGRAGRTSPPAVPVALAPISGGGRRREPELEPEVVAGEEAGRRNRQIAGEGNGPAGRGNGAVEEVRGGASGAAATAAAAAPHEQSPRQRADQPGYWGGGTGHGGEGEAGGKVAGGGRDGGPAGGQEYVAKVFSYCRHGRLEQVQEALGAGFDVCAQRDENGNTLLHCAAQNGLRGMCKSVLQEGRGRQPLNLQNVSELEGRFGQGAPGGIGGQVPHALARDSPPPRGEALVRRSLWAVA